MREYVLAIDGGATKTHLLLMHMETTRFWRVEGGPTNHEVLQGGFDELTFTLSGLLGQLFAQAGIVAEDIAFACIGLAGVDLPWQHRKVSHILESLGIEHFMLVNDSFLPILAEAEDGHGIGVINGTGFSVAAIDVFGDQQQIGGFGEYSEDFGGGGWYAKKAVAVAYRSIYKGGESTQLRERIMQSMKVKSAAGMMESVQLALQSDPKETQKQLCICLHEAADAGDLAAQEVFQDSAMEYAACIRSILLQMNFAAMLRVPVILAGAQFVKGGTYLREMMTTMLPDRCDVRILRVPPVLGALYEALRRQRFVITPEFRAYAEEQSF
jgi:N-acetylglucosamine kinase-like BadF-type ATPase